MSDKRRIGYTAPELLKSYGAYGNHLVNVGRMLRSLAADKGYDLHVIQNLSMQKDFGDAVNNFLTRQPGSSEAANILDYFGSTIKKIPAPAKLQPYRGTHDQNRAIRRALASVPALRKPDLFFGEGAATFFDTGFSFDNERIKAVPIAIIGAGAAGILAAYALKEIGFKQITMFERSERPLGIWSMPNVFQRSRNNPRRIGFFGKDLATAPGDGQEVRKFLERFLQEDLVQHRSVKQILPGKLSHLIRFNSGQGRRFPIVINAIGLGKPKKPSDSKRMLTDVSLTKCGYRWQQNLFADDSDTEPVRKFSGKRLVFIGLGNSTAEMLRQVHNLIDAGHDVDYRVLTHYPQDAVFNPDDTVWHDGRPYRVFRDLSKPNLVDFQGDLGESRYDYYRALRKKKILWGVRSWSVGSRKSLVARDQRGSEIEALPFHELYTLVGYGHTRESLEPMGIAWDDVNECGLFDFDGEAIRNKNASDPNERLHKGYFGFGSVLETPDNPNAVVIPGMVHQIGDLLFGVLLRAAEYANKA